MVTSSEWLAEEKEFLYQIIINTGTDTEELNLILYFYNAVNLFKPGKIILYSK